MPAPDLTSTHPTAAEPIAEEAILTFLATSPVPEGGGEGGLELAEAAAIYQRAGQDAVAAHAGSSWWQIYLEPADWSSAEADAAAHLAPLLHHAQEAGLVGRWWFMRKHPCLRIRFEPRPAARFEDLAVLLDGLPVTGRYVRWWRGLYEAETAAFGGDPGIDIAHQLFAADSHALLTVPAGAVGIGRRELSLLLCGILLRAAGLEGYEQGDVWERVTRDRPLPADVPAHLIAKQAGQLAALARTETTPDGPLFGPGGPAAAAAPWAEAFRTAGQALGAAAARGELGRGLREILAYHVIFHWNRAGLPARQQSVLAAAARTAALGPTPPARG